MTRYPDIEIYVRRVSTDDIVLWLQQHFEQVEAATETASAELHLASSVENTDGQSDGDCDGNSVEKPDEPPGAGSHYQLNGHISCVILEKGARGGYTSVWFKQNKTPWETDLDCARSAFQFFGHEVRCSTGGWSGEDEAGWMRITDAGEQTVNWYQ